MVIPITPKQSKRINALIKKLCYNYVDGSCLLLDDGEVHACVQCISRYGIYCNYFKNAVLPADSDLFAEIMQTASKYNAKYASCTSYQRQRTSATARTAPLFRNGRKPPSASAENGRQILSQVRTSRNAGNSRKNGNRN